MERNLRQLHKTIGIVTITLCQNPSSNLQLGMILLMKNIAQSVKHNIKYNAAVSSIDYSGKKVILKTLDGKYIRKRIKY